MAIYMSIRRSDTVMVGMVISTRNHVKMYIVLDKHLYPGKLITETHNFEVEKAHAGEACSLHPGQVACGLSANAFGKESIQVKVGSPPWWGERARI